MEEQDYKNGDIVRTLSGADIIVKDQYGYVNGNMHAETQYKVTRVNKKTVQIAPADGSYGSITGVKKDEIRLDTEPIKTFLEKFIPESTEVIAPDDPRLDYIWRAAAQAADDQGYCSVYDDIAKRIGIPGRPKNYTVNIQVGNLTTRVTIKARSKAEATSLASAELNKGGTSVSLVTED